MSVPPQVSAAVWVEFLGVDRGETDPEVYDREMCDCVAHEGSGARRVERTWAF